MLLMYIDPGTGSMLFSFFIGIAAALVFLAQKLWLRLKFVLAGGRAQAAVSAKQPYVIFSDSKRYWNVFKPVCDEFERRGLPLCYWTASPDDPALSERYRHVRCEFIGEGNRAFAKLNMMRASICLSTTPGLEVYQWKRSKNVNAYVHIFHTVDEGLGYRMFGMDFYDDILLTGAFQERYIRMLEKLRGLPPRRCFVAGSTYLDAMQRRLEDERAAGTAALASGAPEDMAESAPESPKNTEHKLVPASPENTEHKPAPASPADMKAQSYTVLLAPSWGAYAILKVYGAKLIEELLQTGFYIVIRPHPQSAVSERDMLEALQRRFPDSERLSWNFDNDNFEVLQQADVMITDFSAVIFDFSLIFDKPVIYADTHMEHAPYDSAWIDEPLWRFEVLKKLGIPLSEEAFGNLGEMIPALLADDIYARGRAEVREQAWQYRKEAASRTVDYLEQRYKALNALPAKTNI